MRCTLLAVITTHSPFSCYNYAKSCNLPIVLNDRTGKINILLTLNMLIFIIVYAP